MMLQAARAPTVASTALITGASSGIGWELAGVLAAHGHHLILVARTRAMLEARAAELRRRYPIAVHVIPADLSRASGPAEVHAALSSRGIWVDTLINNAGVGLGGAFIESNMQRQVELLQLNIISLTHLTRLVLPAMVARGYGRIMNVSSIAAFLPGPLTATYNASKAYVLLFSEALAYELRGTGVTVTALCPGPTNTPFDERAGLCGTKAFSGSLMEAGDVAAAGFEAMMKGRSVAVVGLRNRLRMLPIRILPRQVLAHFSNKYHEQSGPGDSRVDPDESALPASKAPVPAAHARARQSPAAAAGGSGRTLTGSSPGRRPRSRFEERS